MLRFLLCALLLGLPLAAGSLRGAVRVLDRDGRARAGLEDVVAILEAVPREPAPGPGETLVIRTVGKRFVPRVAVATPGTEVAFPNLDPILHNVFSVSPGNRFDTGNYRPGDSPRVKLANPGLVKVYCNVHHQMNAFVWVVTTPFAQVLAGRPGLAFEDVPPGSYRLRLWHPEAGEQDWPVRIGAGATTGAWSLRLTLPPVEPHPDKFGHDYPPPADERDY